MQHFGTIQLCYFSVIVSRNTHIINVLFFYSYIWILKSVHLTRATTLTKNIREIQALWFVLQILGKRASSRVISMYCLFLMAFVSYFLMTWLYNYRNFKTLCHDWSRNFNHKFGTCQVSIIKFKGLNGY